MAAPRPLYGSVTSTSDLLNIIVSSSHDSPVTTANIEARSTSLTLGDTVTVNLGYTDDHEQVFRGYVKQIVRKVPNNTYQITAYDELVRAQDYFIASSNPAEPFKRKNIAAEDLVRDLVALAGLTNYDHQDTSFVFGVQNEFEVNLVSVYDYVRTICDTITWNFWADQDGTINFKNRKPYVMMGDTGQPGDIADTPTGYTMYVGGANSDVLDINHTVSEKSLRNRVVVYGTEGVYAEAKAASSVLPDGFYKSAVLAMSQIIDTQGLAQDIANYNLDLLNRITQTISATILGNPSVYSRSVIEVDDAYSLSIDGNWYVFGRDHQWNSQGFVTNIDLRRMLRD
jgi:hypothetical protein